MHEQRERGLIVTCSVCFLASDDHEPRLVISEILYRLLKNLATMQLRGKSCSHSRHPRLGDSALRGLGGRIRCLDRYARQVGGQPSTALRRRLRMARNARDVTKKRLSTMETTIILPHDRAWGAYEDAYERARAGENNG